MTTLAAHGLRVAPGRSARAHVAALPALRPALVIRSALLLLVIGNLGRVPIGSLAAKDAPILFNDILVLAVLATGFVAALRSRALRIDLPALLALVFGAVGALSAVLGAARFGLTGIQLVFSLAYLARWLAYFGIYLVAINTLRPADVPSIWRALEATILAFAVFGIVQSIFLPGFAQLVYPEMGWDIQGRRLVSTLLDPNFAGGLVVIGLLVVLARIAMGISERPWKPLVLVTALLLTLSRSSFAAFALGCVVILAARGISRRFLRLAGAVAALSLPFLPALLDLARAYNKLGIDASALGRLESWLRGVTVFADNPVLGVGFNTYGFVQRAYGWDLGGMARFGLDGGLLFIAVMTGLVGLALYLGMVGSVVHRCRRTWRDGTRSAEDRGLAIGVAAATVAMLVHSVFVNSLLFPFIMEALWVLWALTFVARRPEPGNGPSADGLVVASFTSAVRDGRR